MHRANTNANAVDGKVSVGRVGMDKKEDGTMERGTGIVVYAVCLLVDREQDRVGVDDGHALLALQPFRRRLIGSKLSFCAGAISGS